MGHWVTCEPGYFLRSSDAAAAVAAEPEAALLNRTLVKCCNSEVLRRRIWVDRNTPDEECDKEIT